MRRDVDLAQASRLVNHGPTVRVGSAHGGRRNLMAAAWSMPVEFTPSRIAVVIDKATFTRELVEASGAFSLPCPALADLTWTVGSVSDRDPAEDKFGRYAIDAFDGPVLGLPWIAGCVAWVECRVIPEPHAQRAHDTFFGEVVAAQADARVFDAGRWTMTADNAALRTIHHLGAGRFVPAGPMQQTNRAGTARPGALRRTTTEETTMDDLVLRTDRDGAATLTPNRPDKLNALNVELFEALDAHLDDIERRTDSVGLVIVRGAGRCSSAGHDLGDTSTGEALPRPHFQASVIERLANLPQPVISAAHGHCCTGALELALPRRAVGRGSASAPRRAADCPSASAARTRRSSRRGAARCRRRVARATSRSAAAPGRGARPAARSRRR
jgi:flavin reductase (DIM6/NTAB) family NADH-FMN oxidoreductase RutF